MMQSWILALACVSLASYCLVMSAYASSVARARRSPTGAIAAAPRVSILKPLAGSDDDLLANLESHARIDYPDFEILLGVASLSDPALSVARAFVARATGCHVRLVVTNPALGGNPKVAQLISLERHASGEVIVISDSNVAVPSSYLTSLVGELAKPGVGLVTSIVAGSGEETLGAAIENLQLAAVVAPAVCVSTLLGRPITVGKSMAMWRTQLSSLGGFARAREVLAEDFLLGELFRKAGFTIATTFDVVHNRNRACSIRRTVERHTRWAKMRRSIAPWAFALEPMLCPLLVATLAGVVSPGWASGLLWCACALCQTAGSLMSLRALRGRALVLASALPLEVLRSYLLFACWIFALASRRVRWRGTEFVLGKGSRLLRATPRPLSYKWVVHTSPR